MILRGRLAIRLPGRRRELVPTTLAEGLAYLAITGSFHRYIEVETIGAEELAGQLTAAAASCEWRPSGTAADGSIKLERAADADESSPMPMMLRVTVAERHPRGKPAAAVELIAVPLPPGAKGAAGAELARKARGFAGNRSAGEQFLARSQQKVEQLLGTLAEAVRAVLGVESIEVEVERGLARGWRGDAWSVVPPEAAAWLGALESLGGELAWMGDLPPRHDGGGLFDVHGNDGGGMFDAGGHHDGGGAL